MNKSTLVLLTGLLLLISGQAFGQFTLSAELRPRFEYRDGYRQLASDQTDPIFIISQRTRLKATYKHKIFGMGICFQDVRTWGDDDVYTSTAMVGNSGSTGLYEGWMELYVTPSLTVKAGRQILVYDDERIFSTRNWNQSSVTYDALLLKYKHQDKWDLDLGGSWNNSLEQVYFNVGYPAQKIKMIGFAHFHKPIGKSLNLSLIGVADGFTKNDSSQVIYSRGTYGINLDYQKNYLKFRATGYYQNGANKKGLQVSAFCTSVVGSYTFNKFTIGAGMDYISGQSATKTENSYQEKDHLFELFYGVRHRYYGLMDYFSNMPKSTANGGLMDIYLNSGYKLAEKHNLQLDYHYFSLAQDVKIKQSDHEQLITDRPLGSEVDFLYRYTVNEFLSCDLGYSFMLPAETLKTINLSKGEAGFSQWVYVLITLKPTLLKM